MRLCAHTITLSVSIQSSMYIICCARYLDGTRQERQGGWLCNIFLDIKDHVRTSCVEKESKTKDIVRESGSELAPINYLSLKQENIVTVL